MVETMYVDPKKSQCTILVVNAVVVFHVLTFIVWTIIFAKDLLVETKAPVADKKKKQ